MARSRALADVSAANKNSMSHRDSLLRSLADGSYHSGEDLAASLGVTRAAVWKQIKKLASLGLQVESERGRGYRLAAPIELLDPERLRATCRLGNGASLEALDVFLEIDSTNAFLVRNRSVSQNSLRVCCAEYQTLGRGRRERKWMTPWGSGLCLSVAWCFSGSPRDLSALTLATGVIVRRVVQAVTHADIRLKWPNDLVWQDRKLGGILIEMTAESHGLCQVVIGIGLNANLSDQVMRTLCDWPAGAVDLSTIMGGQVPSRNALAASLISELSNLLSDYEHAGFAPYAAEWRASDCLLNKEVSVMGARNEVSGFARGISDDGALLLELSSGSLKRIVAGDVSVRVS